MNKTCSPARLAANRTNAAKSTGPKTAEGKNRSRGNALKHGLTAEVLLTESEQQEASSHPDRSWQEQYAAVLATRINRAHQAEDSERDRAALRAEVCWDQDRAVEIDRIASGLHRRPDRVVARLQTTPHGCLWLMDRWRLLLAAAGRDGGWNADQTALAQQLRGIPVGLVGATPDPVADPVALASAEIERLSALRDALQPLDTADREAARRGLDDDASPGLRRAIRYVGTLFNRLRWCLGATTEPTPAPAPAPRSAPPTPLPPPPPPPTTGFRPIPDRARLDAMSDEAALAELDSWLADHLAFGKVHFPAEMLALTSAMNSATP